MDIDEMALISIDGRPSTVGLGVVAQGGAGPRSHLRRGCCREGHGCSELLILMTLNRRQ
jgi:hypothetical protein